MRFGRLGGGSSSVPGHTVLGALVLAVAGNTGIGMLAIARGRHALTAEP